MAIDPDYYSSSLLLNCEGTNGSTTFADTSVDPKTPTVSGNTQISTAQFKSGTASALFDGTGDFLTYASNAGFDFGTGDFTIEMWWRPTGAATDYGLMVLAKPTVSTQADLAFGVFHLGATGTGKIQAFINQGTTNYIVNGLSALSAATWYHIVFERISGVLYLYINGVLQGLTAANIVINEPGSRELRIGQWHSGSTMYANGYMDGIRITKGVGRYTENFTPSYELFEASPPETADASLTAPVGALESSLGTRAELTAPAGTLASYTAALVDLTAPMGVMSSSAHDSTGERAFEGVAPMGVLSAFMGADARMTAPAGTLISSVTVPIFVTASLTAPSGVLSASATVAVSVRADLRLSSAGTLAAYAGAVATLDAPSGVLNAVATAGILAHFAGGAPMGVLNAAMSSGIVVNAALVAPMMMPTPSMRADLIAPFGSLSAVSHAVIAITYEAYAINLKPRESRRPGVKPINEVTRYPDVPFDGQFMYQGKCYGWGPGGLYLIGSDTDDEAPIPYVMRTHPDDFGSTEKKTMLSAYFGGRFGPDATITLISGKEGENAYPYTTPRGTVAQNHRQKFGRGIKDRYLALEIAGEGAMELDNLDPEVDKLTRRI